MSGLQTGLFGSLQGLPLLSLECHRLAELLDNFLLFLLHLLQVLINAMRLILGIKCPAQEDARRMVHSLVQVCHALRPGLKLPVAFVHELLLILRQPVILHVI